MMRSLRSRLLLTTAAATLTILAAAGLALYFSIRASLLSELDAAMASKAQSLAGFAEFKRDKIKLELDPGQIEEFSTSPRPEYFEMWGAGGVAVKSASLKSSDLPQRQ